ELATYYKNQVPSKVIPSSFLYIYSYYPYKFLVLVEVVSINLISNTLVYSYY
ncbi:hypothetical protein BC567DRAFT_170032, partial [Phyllosticta citribraziliensis]